MPSSFTTQSRLLTTLNERPYENIVGKGENAGNQHFPMFSTLSNTNCMFSVTYILSSANVLNLDQSIHFAVSNRVKKQIPASNDTEKDLF